jgi:hypothetical protein
VIRFFKTCREFRGRSPILEMRALRPRTSIKYYPADYPANRLSD